MSDSDGRYNGWKNYETWSVSLYIGNDQSTQEHWHARARKLRDNPPPNDVWTVEERSRFALADELKEAVEDGSPLNDSPSLYADLLNAALESVDWEEIAAHLLQAVAE